MSMFKRLKSVFIVEEDIPQKVEDTGQSNKKAVKIDVPINKNASSSEKFVNSLLKAIEANNLEGFDYLEYKQSLQSLVGMDMDESTRFNSAYAMAKTMGADKSVLLESANHYLEVLKKEEGKFNAAYEKQQQKQVGARQEKLKSLQLGVGKKEAQIKKLQEEIKNSKKELDLKKNEIREASSKVAQTRDQFLASYNKVADQIVADIDRMNKFLSK